MELRGIDISYANRNLDYKRIAESGIDFALIRTGYRQKTDDMFEQHMNGCISNGILVGAYVYALARTQEEVVAETDYALNLLRKYKLDFPVFYDLEDIRIADLPKIAMTRNATTFMDIALEEGFQTGVYASGEWLRNNLNTQELISNPNYNIWLAHHTGSPANPTKYNFNQAIWQWGKGKVDGSPSDLDGDISYKNFKAPALKPISEIVKEVRAGLWGNGKIRMIKLEQAGYDYRTVQDAVNAAIDEENKVAVSPLDIIAYEVIAGKWGNGRVRFRYLTEAGYDYAEVMDIVNKKLEENNVANCDRKVDIHGFLQ